MTGKARGKEEEVLLCSRLAFSLCYGTICCVQKWYVLYSAVSSPLDRSKRFTLHLLADLFIPTSGKHSSHAAITREDYSFTFPPPSIARYTLMQLQLSGLKHHGENENAQTSKRLQRGDSNRAQSIASLASYR